MGLDDHDDQSSPTILPGNAVVLNPKAAKRNLLKNLEDVILKVESKHGHCSGDLPPIDKVNNDTDKTI